MRKNQAELRARMVELARFNSVAVGRESRMIELKRLLNELWIRHGEAVRYPLDFEHEATAPVPRSSPSQSVEETAQDVLATGSLVPLESILHTEKLAQRPSRRPDYETEIRALVSLVQSLAESAGATLQRLAETILEVSRADSAGISLLTEDKKRFYWPAISGVWQPHIGGGTPRHSGPCGDVLDRPPCSTNTRSGATPISFRWPLQSRKDCTFPFTWTTVFWRRIQPLRSRPACVGRSTEAEGTNKVALAKCEALSGDAQSACKDQANAALDMAKAKAKGMKAAHD